MMSRRDGECLQTSFGACIGGSSQAFHRGQAMLLYATAWKVIMGSGGLYVHPIRIEVVRAALACLSEKGVKALQLFVVVVVVVMCGGVHTC